MSTADVKATIDEAAVRSLVDSYQAKLWALEMEYAQGYEDCVIVLDHAGVPRTADGVSDHLPMVERIRMLAMRANQLESENEEMAAQIADLEAELDDAKDRECGHPKEWDS